MRWSLERLHRRFSSEVYQWYTGGNLNFSCRWSNIFVALSVFGTLYFCNPVGNFFQGTTTYVYPAFHFIALLMFDRTKEMKKPSRRQRAVNDCFIIFKFFSWILRSLPQFTEGIWHSENVSNVFRPLSKACQTEGTRFQVTCRNVYQMLFLLLCHSQTRKMF